MTLLILILSEIIPKSLGAAYWRSLAPIVSLSINILEYLMYPFVIFSEKLSKLLSGPKDESMFHHDEFKAMAKLGSEEGKLKEKESRIVRNLFRLRELTVRDIMTPRPVVFSLPSATKISDVMAHYSKLPFSRIPVYNEDRDNIIGFVLKNDIFYEQAINGGNKALRELKRDLHAVSDWIPLSKLLEFLLDNRQHILMVTNEFGAFDGVVTLEDTVETLLGMEIVDEADLNVDMRRLAREKWRKRIEKMDVQMPPMLKDAFKKNLIEEKQESSDSE
jgi:CBS domain containing-hemolysin-like protein